MNEAVLVIVEDRNQRAHISAALGSEGYPVVEAESGLRGLELLAHQPDIACVLVQIDLADMKGMNFVKRIHGVNAHVLIIILVRSEEQPRLAQLLDSGADDFLVMPPSPLRLKVTLNTLFRHRTVKAQAGRVRRYAEDHLTFKDLVAKSVKMRDLVAQAKHFVRQPVNLFISGEPGCEHELIARIIHREDRTRRGAFVRLQCSDSSEIGASTHNWRAQLLAKLHQAHHGSLCLADIERLDETCQHILLELIEKASIGRDQDVRFFATTTIEKDSLVKWEKFDARLLTLLGRARLEIAPLRERRQDIEELCHVILRVVIAETGRRQIKNIGTRALALCQDYDWPGNLAELENALFRAVLLSDGPVLSVHDFPQIWHRERLKRMEFLKNGTNFFSSEGGEVFWDEFGHIRPFSEIEKLVLDAAMQRYGGHLSEIARRLGIGRTTLYRKIETYQIKERFEE